MKKPTRSSPSRVAMGVSGRGASVYATVTGMKRPSGTELIPAACEGRKVSFARMLTLPGKALTLST
jgi:hypothetical protein